MSEQEKSQMEETKSTLQTTQNAEDDEPDNHYVTAFIRDKSFKVNIADGSQKVEWLADVVLFMYKRSQFEKMNCRGVKLHNKLLDLQETISSQIQNKDEVYILLQGDEEVDGMFGDEV